MFRHPITHKLETALLFDLIIYLFFSAVLLLRFFLFLCNKQFLNVYKTNAYTVPIIHSNFTLTSNETEKWAEERDKKKVQKTKTRNAFRFNERKRKKKKTPICTQYINVSGYLFYILKLQWFYYCLYSTVRAPYFVHLNYCNTHSYNYHTKHS